MARILSLDISTTTIGISVLEHNNGKNIKLLHQEFYKPPKIDIFEMLLDVSNHMRSIYDTWKPDEIAIEEFIQFMKGGSGAKTIIPLAVLNRVIGFCFFIWTGQTPILYSVMTIRHTIKFGKKIPPKEDIPEIVAKHLQIEFPYYYKTNKRGKQTIMTESYDVADSIAVGLTHIKKTN